MYAYVEACSNFIKTALVLSCNSKLPLNKCHNFVITGNYGLNMLDFVCAEAMLKATCMLLYSCINVADLEKELVFSLNSKTII